MTADVHAELSALIAELARRDDAVARDIDLATALAERVGALRSRAASVREALSGLPAELAAIGARRADAEESVDALSADLARVETRVAELESSRRRRGDELERARSEVATARDALADALAHLDRLVALDAQLRSDLASLDVESERLAEEGAELAADLRAVERLAEGARRDPGTALDELEDWSAQARSALFVVRGTLETERERIVIEANALGSSVLGEQLGASSVAVVRRRVDDALGRG